MLFRRLGVVGLILAVLVVSIGLSSPVQAATDRVIYGDALGSGVQDWSWNTTVNAANASPVQAGTHSLAVTYTAAWAGLYLHLDSAQNTAGYDRIRFYVRGGSTTAQMRFVVDGTQAGATISAPSGSWTLVERTLGSLGAPATFHKLVPLPPQVHLKPFTICHK